MTRRGSPVACPSCEWKGEHRLNGYSQIYPRRSVRSVLFRVQFFEFYIHQDDGAELFTTNIRNFWSKCNRYLIFLSKKSVTPYFPTKKNEDFFGKGVLWGVPVPLAMCFGHKLLPAYISPIVCLCDVCL